MDMNQALRERWKEIEAADFTTAPLIELLKAFVRDFPNVARGWVWFGKILSEVSRFEEAEYVLRKAIELARPAFLLYCYDTMGDLYRYKGEFVTAEYWYRKAIDHSPDDTQGYIGLGAMLARIGRLDEAEALHRRGTVCETGDIDESYFNLGLILRAKERYSEALACFEAALKIDPQYKLARLAKRDVQHAMRLLSPAEKN